LTPPPGPTSLGPTDPALLRQWLRGPGVHLDLGLVTAHLRSDSADLAAAMSRVYARAQPLPASGAFADVHVRIERAAGWRRWIRPQVVLRCDSHEPFEPFPADHALPLLEWGLNWLIARRMNDVLLLHAGVLERDGLALVMPAVPGSGKSTLSAALSLRGWRLLSDEFGALDTASLQFRAVLKPVALKNESIEVIRRFEPAAPLGPAFEKTRKGTVAHLAPDAASALARHQPAAPGAVVFPRWVKDSPTLWKPVHPRVVFSTLAFNAFNYEVLGADAFLATVEMVRRCPAWQLIYSDLDQALATLDQAWPEVRERAQAVASHARAAATGKPAAPLPLQGAPA
jgi:HprK-related kinase A